MTKDFDSIDTPAGERAVPDLEILLEVARRANWDALHGPKHLRAGRFRPDAGDPPEVDPASEPVRPVDGAPRQD